MAFRRVSQVGTGYLTRTTCFALPFPHHLVWGLSAPADVHGDHAHAQVAPADR
jgi:hypothetical protein